MVTSGYVRWTNYKEGSVSKEAVFVVTIGELTVVSYEMSEAMFSLLGANSFQL